MVENVNFDIIVLIWNSIIPTRFFRTHMFYLRIKRIHIAIRFKYMSEPEGGGATLFWVLCPNIARYISALESRGLVKEWSDRVDADPDLCARYVADRGLPESE